MVSCHSEGYRRGVASGHADVEHWFPKHGKRMDDFRRDVAAELAPKPAPELQPKPEPEPKPQPAPQPESGGEKEEDDDMTYYETLNDVPESYRPTIRKLMETGALKGRSDPDPDSLEDNVLSVSEDYCRVMTTLDRMGLFNK